MQLTTESGTAIRLGKEIGRGGEATVFAVQGVDAVVAKIYQRAPPKSLSKKLRDMVAIGRGSSELGRLAAWPTDLLVESSSQDLKGFLMRRVDGHFPVHELYTPKSRHERFPTASWKFLVHAAMNVCEAFRLIHENGIVIGDVNHSNLLISPRATAFLIDCDSMGVNRGDCIHPCSGVGIREFLPPELQVDFCGSQRTTNHDLFGLAVILFQLLFGGRHPFTGMLRAATKCEVPECGEAIREGDFAYSRIRIGRLQPKAGWPGLDIVGEKCEALFEKAFLNVPGCKRPAAEEWGGALRLLLQDVKVCSRSRDHVYHRPIGSCPWCKLLVAEGYDLFAGSARQFDSWSPSRSRLPELLREYINLLQEYQKCIDLSHQPAYTCSPRPLGFTLVSEPVSPGPSPEPAAFAIPTGEMPIYRPPDLPPLVLLQRPDRPDPPEIRRLISSASLRRHRSLTETIWRWICRRSTDDSPPAVASNSLDEIDGVDYQLACGKYELRLAAWRIEATRVDQENNRRQVVHKHEVERINQEARRAFQAELETWREHMRQVELRVARSFQTALMNWQQKMDDFSKRQELWRECVSSYNKERKNRSDLLSTAIAECAKAESELIKGVDNVQSNLHDVLRRKPADLEREGQDLIAEYRRQCQQKAVSGDGLDQHLATVPLSSGINTIGSGVLYYSLLQFGIRTAADCGDFNRLTRVRGIGPGKAAAIMQWRKVVISEWQRQKAKKTSVPIVEINRRFGKQAEQLELVVDSLIARIRDELAKSRLADLKAHYHNCLRIRSQCEADMLPCL